MTHKRNDKIIKSVLSISSFNISHQVKPVHVDKDVAEESLEHFAEGVGHQPNKA